MSGPSELQQTSYASELSDIASPLNSVRSNQSPAAAARRVGLSTHGVNIQLAKQAALNRLATKAKEEQVNTLGELDRFDERLEKFISDRPLLAVTARRCLGLEVPKEGPGYGAVVPLATRDASQNTIARAFQKIDKQGTGMLTRAEVSKAVREDSEVRRLLNLPLLIRVGDGSRELLESVFQALEAGSDESISFDEFAAFFTGVGNRASQSGRPSSHNQPPPQSDAMRRRPAPGPGHGFTM